MKGIKERLAALERKQEQKPPFDLEGRYYDSLSDAEKRRYWRYFYGGTYTLEQAEALEMKHISGTLHFKCFLKPGDILFPAFDEWKVALDRVLDKSL